jgi:hypothetical protein
MDDISERWSNEDGSEDTEKKSSLRLGGQQKHKGFYMFEGPSACILSGTVLDDWRGGKRWDRCGTEVPFLLSFSNYGGHQCLANDFHAYTMVAEKSLSDIKIWGSWCSWIGARNKERVTTWVRGKMQVQRLSEKYLMVMRSSLDCFEYAKRQGTYFPSLFSLSNESLSS